MTRGKHATADGARAEDLWTEVRSAFVNAEAAIRAIIAERAWGVLGYATFGEAWADRMRGVPIATDAAKAVAIYALLDEGLPDDEIADMLYGIGPVMVARARANRSMGIPAERGLIHRRATYAEAPSRSWVRIEVDEPTRTKWAALAATKGVDLTREAEVALRVWFERLERESRLSA